MSGAGYYHHAVNSNDDYLSEALAEIPSRGIVSKVQYNAYIAKYLKALPLRHGIGTASRLVAMKRPDQFVCLDSKNQGNLCENFGIAKTSMSYDRYWGEVIERVMDAPWWNSPRPSAPLPAAVWDGRAAMLDAIFYEA